MSEMSGGNIEGSQIAEAAKEPVCRPDSEVAARLGQAEAEKLLAQTRLDHARIESELKRLRSPWWRSWNVTVIGAFIAAVAPITAGIEGYFQKQKEVEIQEQKQLHEIAMAREKQTEEIRKSYLDRLKDPAERMRVLRFLIATASDPAIKVWSQAELQIVEKEGAKREQEYLVRQQSAREAELELEKRLQ